MTPKRIRVLVVDDVESIIEAITDALSEYDVIEVVGAGRTGVEAVQLADELRPDVILMDVRMPEMDGIRATRTIKDAGNRAKVLMMTAYDDDSLVREAMDAGAVGHLVKGTLVADIVAAIRERTRALPASSRQR